MDTDPDDTQTLDLLDKEFTSTILNTFKEFLKILFERTKV